jgi:hypothetical protein
VNPLAFFVAPLLLLVPAPVAVNAVQDKSEPAAKEGSALARPQGAIALPEGFERGPWEELASGFIEMSNGQVRIEQTLTIRVTPRAAPAQPIMLADLPQNGLPSRLEERRMGRCVPMAGIAGMQYGGDRRLILFLRDRRIVSATLEKSCRARDYYSGFYVARNGDGMLCQDRDQLQSRSGANCQVDNFKQLVDADD